MDTVEATSQPAEHAVTEPPVPGGPGGSFVVCRGCGATYFSTDADMIVDHVKGCALVDGAGNPLPGGAA